MKKKNKFIFLATLSTACLLSLASCQGAQGPKGDQGESGINGTNGKDGENGKDGTSLLNGKGAPTSSLGSNGDSYIDTESFDFYAKENGAWVKKGSLKGDSEIQKGEDGTSIRTGKGVPASTLGKDGDSYIDLSTFDFYVKENGKWSKEGNIKGDKGNTGASGSAGLPGATAWSNTILPSDDGYVTVSKGSALENETITFTAMPDPGKELSIMSIYNNGTLIKNTSETTFETTMKKGGFVVSAKFVNQGDALKSNAVECDDTMYDSLNAAVTSVFESKDTAEIKLLKASELTGEIEIAKGKTLTLDLNGYNLDAKSYTIKVAGKLVLVNSDKSKIVTVSGSGTEAIIKLEGGEVEKNLSRNKSIDFGGFSTMSRAGSNLFDDADSSTVSLNVGERVILASTSKAPAIKSNVEGAEVLVAANSEVKNTSSEIDAKAIEVVAGKVNVEGNVSSTAGSALSVSGGEVEVKGEVTTESGKAIEVTSSATEDTTVTISGDAKVSASKKDETAGTAIEVAGGKVTVSGTVSSSDGTAVKVSGGSLEVKKDEESTNEASISGAENGVVVTNGSVSVSSGEVKTNSSTGAAISVESNSEDSKIEVEVTGGTIKNENTESGSAIKQTGSTGSAEVKVSGKDTTIVDSENKEGSLEVAYYSLGIGDGSKSKVQLVKDSDGNKSIKITIDSEESNMSSTLSSAIQKAVALDSSIEDVKVQLPSTGESTIELKSLVTNSSLQASLKDKNITLIGSKDENGNLVTKYSVLKQIDSTGEAGSDYSFQNCKNISFEDMYFNFGHTDYNGFVRGKNYTFKNCTIDGRITYCGEDGLAKFDGCTFNSISDGDYCMTVYSRTEYQFSNCTFNNSTKGKFLNVYAEENGTRTESVKISVEGCTFNGASENGNKPVLAVKLFRGNNWNIVWNNNTVNNVNACTDSAMTVNGTDDTGFGVYNNVFGVEGKDGKKAEIDYSRYASTTITVDGTVRFSNLQVK